MDKKIDCISELRGEYNISVLEGDRTVYESGWCQNTILSKGLENLYDKPILNLTGMLDLGNSDQYPGVEGYNLDGVVDPSDSTTFLNVPRSRHTIYTEKDAQGVGSTRVFYSYFITNEADSPQTFAEFAIKSDKRTAFARNTFKNKVTVQTNQYIVMEYRLRVRRSYSFTSKLPFETGSNQLFTIPCSGVCFNIPYNEMYRNDNELSLLAESSNLPPFGVKWPEFPTYGIRSRIFSTFKPTEIGYSLDNTTRSFTVSTIFANISAQPSGLYNRINTLLLSRSSDVQFDLSLPNSAFLGVKFKFPLALYNYENSSFDINGTISENIVIAKCYGDGPYRCYPRKDAPISRYNKFDILINYTWREAN